MRVRRTLLALFLVLSMVVGYATASQAGCSIRPGVKVALSGDVDDPDVFVWDSRFRLAAYQGGSYDVSRALLPHANVVHQGTRALVVACHPNAVRPKYGNAFDDAVGIIIISGPHRGEHGWVMGTDVRRLVTPKRIDR